MDVVMNVSTTSLSETGAAGTTIGNAVRFQNNIQSIFQRVRVLYGGTVLEDMNNYNTIVRCLTEWTANSPHMTMDQSTINEGIGGIVMDYPQNTVAPTVATYASNTVPAPFNVRQKFIQGCGSTNATPIVQGTGIAGKQGASNAPPGYTAITNYTPITQRYQIQFALGLFSQGKYIPTKFMASQLAIEITLEQSQFSLFTDSDTTGAGVVGTTPTYGVGNITLLPEILEFDPSYDAIFLKGLQEGGVPIKFSTWNTYIFSTAAQSNVNLNISERQRSVKALFVVQKRSQPTLSADNGATFFDTYSSGTSSLQQYQFRIGGRYFPGQPVQCCSQVGSAINNGGAEAWLELCKALKIVGDYRLSTPANMSRWAIQASASGVLLEKDFNQTILYTTSTTGCPVYMSQAAGFPSSTTNGSSGTSGSSCFAMAINLETSNGVDISGLNAEEQSDISFMATWKQNQITANLEVYSYVDSMLVLRENNMIELIK